MSIQKIFIPILLLLVGIWLVLPRDVEDPTQSNNSNNLIPLSKVEAPLVKQEKNQSYQGPQESGLGEQEISGDESEEHARQEKKENLEKIKKLIAELVQDSDRVEWARQWPRPKNSQEQLLLLTLATEQFPYEGKSFDQMLEISGQYTKVYPELKLENYMGQVLDAAGEKQDFHLRSQIYKYNSRFALAEPLSEGLNRDIQSITSGELKLETPTVQSYFDAMMESGDVTVDDKYLSGLKMIQDLPPQQMGPMLQYIDQNVAPLVNLTQ